MKYEVNLLRPNKISDLSRKIKDSPLPINAIALSLSFTALLCLSLIITTGIYMPRKKIVGTYGIEEKKIVEMIESVQQQRKAMKEKIDQLVELKKEDIEWAEKLKDLSYIIPEGVWLREIRVVDDQESHSSRARRARSLRKNGRDSEDTGSYNLFGQPIQKPKKLLYITGVIDIQAESAPIAILNKLITNLVHKETFNRDFEILDWRLIGDGNDKLMGLKRGRVWKRLARASGSLGRGEEQGRKTVDFELKMGVKTKLQSPAENMKNLVSGRQSFMNFLKK